MASAATELRAAMIAAAVADAGVQATAMGASPRIVNRVPPRMPFPYIALTTSRGRPWDTTSDRGFEFDVELRLHGQGAVEGDEEGEAIFDSTLRLFRDWAPQTFSTHRLVNLVCTFNDVRQDEGARYIGLQRWRAATEETS